MPRTRSARQRWELDALESRLLCHVGADGIDHDPTPVISPVSTEHRHRHHGHRHGARHSASPRPVVSVATSTVARVGENHGLAFRSLQSKTPTRRTATSGSDTTTAAAVGAAALSAVPALSSLPGAAATLYLDFIGAAATAWGSYNVPTTPAYDVDGDATSFSDTELSNINEIWARVAEKYSPFKINVTTVDPGAYNNKAALRVVVGGDGAWLGSAAGGVSYVGSFYNNNPNTAWVFPKQLSGGNPKYTAEAAAHEAGHSFGLQHQSTYNGTTKTAEYNPGSSAKAPVMGNSYSATRGLWWNGQSSVSSGSIQDDLSVLSSSTNGFGYRADDHGDTAAVADPVTVSTPTTVSASGIITTIADVDAFTFTTGAGTNSFTVSNAAKGGMLDAKLTLEDLDGNVIASSDTAALNETLTRSLAAGTYVVRVASHGTYGDIGQYTLTGTVVAPPNVPTPAANLVATPTSTTQVKLVWLDNSSNETGFKIERSLDGTTFTSAGTVAANATTYTDSGLNPGTLYWYRVRAVNGTVEAAPTTAASAVTVGNGAGLLAEYYGDDSLGDQVLQRTDPTIDFNWGVGSPDPSLPSNVFSVRWSGEIQAQYSGSYTLRVLAKGGVRVTVDGATVIDNWVAPEAVPGDANADGTVDIADLAVWNNFFGTGTSPAEGDFNGDGTVDIADLAVWNNHFGVTLANADLSAHVDLQAGKRHAITVEYFKETGPGSMQLQWSSLQVSPQVVPKSQLYTSVS